MATMRETGAAGAVATGAVSSYDVPFAGGAQARFDVANAGGGVNGRQIVATKADDQSSSSVTLASVKGLVESQGVFAVLSGAPPYEVSMLPYEVANNIPEFEPFVVDPLFATAKNLFSIEGAWDQASGGSLNGPVIAQFLKQKGVHTAAIFATPDPASEGAANGYISSMEKDGIKVVYSTNAAPYTAFDATNYGLRLKQAHPDAVIFPIGLPPSISIVKAMTQQGFTPKVSLLTTGYDPSALGTGITGAWTSVSYTPWLGTVSALSTGAQTFRKAMAQYQPQTQLGLFAPAGWATVDLFVHVLQLAGSCPTRAGLISAMRAVSSYNPGGIMPTNVQYSPGLAPDGNPVNCSYFVQVQASSFTQTSTPVCTPIS